MVKPLALTSLALALGIAVFIACTDSDEISQPSGAAAAVSHRLTIKGLGTGTGRVTSNRGGINCTITAGVAAATGCTALITHGTWVTLTALPATGHSFVEWRNACTGSAGCQVRMTTARTVSARFLKGPFTLKVSSGTMGTGSGRVTSQSGLTPVIDCVITNGTPAATGCSARYPAYTQVTLTATPAAGFAFSGWPEPTCGTGSCQYTVIQFRTIPVTFTATTAGSPASQGQWDPVFPTPALGIHVNLLPTGKALLWGFTGDAQLWDPGAPSAGFTAIPKTHRIFCSGHTFDAEGRLVVVGGTSPGTRGLRDATRFDPVSPGWGAIASMAQGRYYPTITTLPDGNVLAVSGHDTTLQVVTIPEVWDGSAWRRLTTAPLAIPAPYYPAMFVAPNGQVFLAGHPHTTRYLDVSGTGRWTTVGNRTVADRTLGSAVMYAPGKVLYVGGGDPPTSSAEVIDLNSALPSWRLTTPMAFARKQTNLTVLADGTVLVTGGTSGAGFNDQAGAVHSAELWNPETERWTTMLPEAKNRTYHSAAMLLPDARVLSIGGGEGGGISFANSELSGQIFSPPYLFSPDGTPAPRPTIASAPARIGYGQSFSVQSPEAAAVTRGSLIRLSSVTHSFNQSQVIYPLAFSPVPETGSVTAQGPPNGNLAPPGPYMLFLINDSGVPSVAQLVTVGP